MNIARTSITQKRLRTLAPRALRITDRHKALHVGIAAVGGALAPAAAAYIKVYDEAVRYDAIKQAEMTSGRASMLELDTLIRSSVAILRHLVPSFDPPELNGTVDTPDRLISDGHKVIELFVHAGSSAPQGEAVIGALTAVVEKAEQSWAQAQSARVELQRNQGIVREHALAFNSALIALRRTLRAVVGTSHLDYQMLRASRKNPSEVADEDDSVVEEGPTEAQTPEAPGIAPTNGAPASHTEAA